jgi:hypothetical protein
MRSANENLNTQKEFKFKESATLTTKPKRPHVPVTFKRKSTLKHFAFGDWQG